MYNVLFENAKVVLEARVLRFWNKFKNKRAENKTYGGGTVNVS